MSTTRQLIRKSLEKFTPMIIGLGIVSGLEGKIFIEVLWQTRSVSAAWQQWLARGVPELPVTLAMLVVLIAVVIAWDVRAQRIEEDRDELRPDGYRPGK